MARHNPQPPPIAGCNLLLFTWRFVTQEEVQEVTLGYKSAVPDANVIAAQSAILTFHVVTNIALWTSVLTGDTSFFGAYVADLAPGVNPTLFQAPAAPTVGTVAGHALPAEVTAVLEKFTSLKGQHGRGRMEMPAVPISFTTPATNPNVLNAAGLVAYQNPGTLLTTPVASGGVNYSPCLIARANPDADPIILANNLAILVNDYDVRENLGTQRRRYPGRGI